MSTVINILEGVEDLQLNQFERASTHPGTQTVSISSATEQFISVDSEEEIAESGFIFFSLTPLQGLFAPNRQQHLNVTLVKGNSSQGRGVFGEEVSDKLQ